MASNDEYQQVGFWNNDVNHDFVVNKNKSFSTETYWKYITAPLDPILWTKTETGWEYKLK